METAISVPDDTYEQASRRAAALGMSRSEFVARAARHYLAELDATSLTRQVDAVLERLDVPGESAGDAVVTDHHLLATTDDHW